MQGLFLAQRSGPPLVYDEGHQGWVQLQGVAPGAGYRPMSCPRGEQAGPVCTMTCLLGPGGQVQGHFPYKWQRAPVREGWEVGWERSHKGLSVSPAQALPEHSSLQVRFLWALKGLWPSS